MKNILSISKGNWLDEACEIENYYRKFGDKLPGRLSRELEELKKRLEAHPN